MKILDTNGNVLIEDADISALKGADLRKANLKNVDLSGADLRNTILERANLKGANLRYVDLRHAILRNAILRNANLSYTDLEYVNFEGADLTGTCLDPNNLPNMKAAKFKKFESRSGITWCIGYRTKNSICINSKYCYKVGTLYEAPWFSTNETEYHPGLYVEPNKRNDATTKKYGVIKVIFPDYVLHKANGSKYRVKWFVVIDEDFAAEEYAKRNAKQKELKMSRFIDNKNGTMTHNKTGVVWIKHVNLFDRQIWD